MKELHPDARADQAQEPDPWVQEGLRALRQQVPSDESRRATLAQLGIGNEVVAADAAAPVPRTSRSLLCWLLGGALLGVLALVVQRWLG
jgi:hypothetical protein